MSRSKMLSAPTVNKTNKIWYHKYGVLLIGMLCFSQSYASTHHVVESGETLSGIAKRYNISQTALIDTNGLTASIIKIGQILDIPEKGSYHNIYKVKVGDNLTYLAKKYQIDINELARVNKLSPDSGLLIDSTLIIPSSKLSANNAVVKKVETTTKGQANTGNVQSKPTKQVVTPTATTANRQNTVTHRVKYGETLSVIANNHKVDVQSLARANNMGINDTLYFGKYLIVPTTVQANTQRVVSTTNKPVAKPSTYTVQRGNTLMGIANKHNTDFMQIAKLTGISPYDALQVGQQLTLPSNANITATSEAY